MSIPYKLDAAFCVITFLHNSYVMPSTSLPTLPWPVCTRRLTLEPQGLSSDLLTLNHLRKTTHCVTGNIYAGFACCVSI